jgi:hypothetical protein
MPTPTVAASAAATVPAHPISEGRNGHPCRGPSDMGDQFCIGAKLPAKLVCRPLWRAFVELHLEKWAFRSFGELSLCRSVVSVWRNGRVRVCACRARRNGRVAAVMRVASRPSREFETSIPMVNHKGRHTHFAKADMGVSHQINEMGVYLIPADTHPCRAPCEMGAKWVAKWVPKWGWAGTVCSTSSSRRG